MSKPAIKMIQTGLLHLGHDPGPLDGVLGPRTMGALEAWVDALSAKEDAPTGTVLPETRAMILQGSARHPVREVVIHCSATRADWMHNATLAEQVAEIRRWHMRDRGWRDIGYHWIVGRSGQVLAGRPETSRGAGVEGHNAGVIHVCLIGGHGSSARDAFSRHFTGAQDITLRQMLQGIGMRTQVTRISGHNEWAAKACPGFHVPTWLKREAA
jgi:hypothetical protein